MEQFGNDTNSWNIVDFPFPAHLFYNSDQYNTLLDFDVAFNESSKLIILISNDRLSPSLS